MERSAFKGLERTTVKSSVYRTTAADSQVMFEKVASESGSRRQHDVHAMVKSGQMYDLQQG